MKLLQLFSMFLILCSSLAANPVSTNSTNIQSNTTPQEKLPTTMEEFNALSHDEQLQVYREMLFREFPQEFGKKIKAWGREDFKASRQRSEKAQAAWIQMFIAGRDPMKALFGYAKKVEIAEIESRFSDSSDPACIKLLKENEDLWKKRGELLYTTLDKPKVAIWQKFKPAFGDNSKVGERYPLSKATRETVEAFEKDLKPLIEELEKLPRGDPGPWEGKDSVTNSVATPGGSPSK